MWNGSAAIVKNEVNELLMVLQAANEEKPKWSVPSGEKHVFESYELCCKREVEEETGFVVSVNDEFFSKSNDKIIVKYFKCSLIGGCKKIQDPDNLIIDVEWISKEKLETLELSYDDDLDILRTIY